MLAAFTLVRVFEWAKKQDWRRFSYTVGAMVALGCLLENSLVLPKRQSAEAFHNSLGVMYQAEGRLDDALREYHKALEFSKVSTLYANLGLVYLLKKDYRSAAKNYHQAFDMDPENAETCFQLGLSFLNLHKLNEARLYFEKSVVLNPHRMPLAYYHLAFIYATQGESSKAEKAMKTYLRLNPQDKKSWEAFLRYSREKK